MNTIFLSRFYKDLDKIRDKHIKERLLKIIEEVESASRIYEIKNIKKLAGDKISYRIRLADYGIGIYYENNTIEFVRIVHRKDIYKVFP